MKQTTAPLQQPPARYAIGRSRAGGIDWLGYTDAPGPWEAASRARAAGYGLDIGAVPWSALDDPQRAAATAKGRIC